MPRVKKTPIIEANRYFFITLKVGGYPNKSMAVKIFSNTFFQYFCDLV